jgi:hypothetical protein
MDCSRHGRSADSDRRDHSRARWPPPAGASLLALVCLAAIHQAAIAGGPPPVIGCGGDGAGQRCQVSRLPPVIADREVTPYLKSGLTATFIIKLTAKDDRGRRMTTSVYVEVRFEPWDEVFCVVVVRPGIAAERFRLESIEKLQSWWTTLKLPFAMASVAAGEARLEVTLLPFSGEEETETRQWYAEALRVDRRHADGRRQADERGIDRDLPRVGEVLDSLTLTSIKRHGVLHFEWSARVEREP